MTLAYLRDESQPFFREDPWGSFNPRNLDLPGTAIRRDSSGHQKLSTSPKKNNPPTSGRGFSELAAL